MRNVISVLIFALASIVATSAFAETYKLDPAHSSALFRVKYKDVNYVFGMFLKNDATLQYDEAAPGDASIEWTINADSVFTNNKKRDDHLRSPDFFDAKQFPTVQFKSTKVEKVNDDSLRVTGDLTMHGVTKEVTTVVEITGKGKEDDGKTRIGMFTSFNVKRSDFGIKTMPDVISDRVHIILTFSGTTAK